MCIIEITAFASVVLLNIFLDGCVMYISFGGAARVKNLGVAKLTTQNQVGLFVIKLGVPNTYRDHATSSVSAVLPPPGQRCGTVCLNSFSSWTSPSDNSNNC